MTLAGSPPSLQIWVKQSLKTCDTSPSLAPSPTGGRERMASEDSWVAVTALDSKVTAGGRSLGSDASTTGKKPFWRSTSTCASGLLSALMTPAALALSAPLGTP
jgi:hypothetical protein